MEEKHIKVVNEAADFKGKYEAINGIEEEPNAEIVHLQKELTEVKGDNRVLNERCSTTEGAMKISEADLAAT
ncbi:hypothetical protein Dimus_005710, partial [Dionaea muscipula]